ncbi:response regulator [Eubacteriaceae bacterium ES2]|nr:response regulator [Eubacteriaceae bacterium ES2]
MLQNYRALVVDDHENARLIMSDMLSSLGLAVDLATDGFEAVKKFSDNDKKGQAYDLVFMDMQMPGMSGVQTIETIKNQITKKVPYFIIVTAYGREEVFLKAKQIEVDLILVKPVNLWVLNDVVHQLLEKKEERSFEKNYQQTDNSLEKQISKIAGARILLVEDNEINQEVVLEILKEGQVVVKTVTNGQLAVDEAEKNKYDIILMDMQMPVMDGLEATERIRAKVSGATVPIIAMTANAMRGDRERCLQAGMNGYLSKPIDPVQLFETLLKWIKPEENSRPVSVKPEETDVQLIKIEGLDMETGINRIMGKKKSYIKLLKKFADGQKKTGSEIESAIDQGDFTKAARLIHSLKGVAGNIGATRVAKKAESLETAIREQPGKATLKPLIEELSKELDQLIVLIKLNYNDESEKLSHENEVNVSDEIIIFLETLIPYLKARKPKPCAELIEEKWNRNWTEKIQTKVDDVINKVLKYRFKEAQADAECLLAKLKEEKHENFK